jgi:hypothetical protein
VAAFPLARTNQSEVRQPPAKKYRGIRFLTEIRSRYIKQRLPSSPKFLSIQILLVKESVSAVLDLDVLTMSSHLQ